MDASSTKQIAVVTAVTGNSTVLAIEPGTTPRDIRRQLNLDENYILTAGRGAEAFGDDENIYPLVPNGAKLYASTPVEVGNDIADLLRQMNTNIPSVSRPMVKLPVSQLLPDWEDSEAPAISPFKYRPLPVPPDTGKIRTVRTIPTSVTRVERQALPYWQERGWTQNGRHYTGYYRSKAGAWKGRAEAELAGTARLFIHKPPEFLENHSHWPCFQLRSGGWYAIHTTEDANLSDSILRVEEILNEAFREAYQ